MLLTFFFKYLQDRTSHYSLIQVPHLCSMKQIIIVTRKLSSNLLCYVEKQHLQQLVLMHQLDIDSGA